MVGKGSAAHNSRKFQAENVKADHTQYNIEYCNENIKQVYHDLFDEARERYNAKQTRDDRRIDDYYDKIQTGKQEKLFHEVIFQIGNKDDMNAQSDNGELAKKMLDEFMQDFQRRNPYLKVFSAHLHMDEETPNLHIDFVPYMIGSKRGMDARVSLKQALASQGFKGGTRRDTEWNQWIESEKHVLSKVMERHGVIWKQLGTHNKHLSVLDFEKQERSKEVQTLKNHVVDVEHTIHDLEQQTEKKKAVLQTVKVKVNDSREELKQLEGRKVIIERNVHIYEENPEWKLPDPAPLMSAKSYKEKKVLPLVGRLKEKLRAITIQYIQLLEKVKGLQKQVERHQEQNKYLKAKLNEMEAENVVLRGEKTDLDHVRRVLGDDKIKSIIANQKASEEPNTPPKQHWKTGRGER